MEKSYNYIIDNIKKIKDEIHSAAINAGRNPEEISLMAVTKTVPPELVNVAVENGVTLLGENRAQEFLDKRTLYAKQGEVHFIGALQTNKVKQIIDKVTMIQSLDRLSLAKEIDKQAKAKNQVMDVLIQVNVGEEDTKSGVLPEEVTGFYQQIKAFEHLNIRGIMSIPPICKDNERLIWYFSKLRQYLVDIRAQNSDNSSINVLSIGMSDDYKTAIACGSTLVRIGSAIFGVRN